MINSLFLLLATILLTAIPAHALVVTTADDWFASSAGAQISLRDTPAADTITDENPPAGKAFYRFEALLAP